jgi:hypothetical protein
MKLLLNFLFIVCSMFCFAQTKQELIDSIIKGNVVDSECIGIVCMKGPQYQTFEKLKKMISEKELLELANNKSPAMRAFALKEVVALNIGNIANLYEKELRRNEEIEVEEGCLSDFKKTYSFLYNEINYRFNPNNKIENNNPKSNKNIIEKVDSLLIYSKKDLDWSLYDSLFRNNKFDRGYLPRIEEMAFKENNFYALNYLRINYSNEYELKIDKYLNTRFLKAKFENYDKCFHLYEFVNLLLESKNETYKKIVVEKVKSVKKLYGLDNSFKSLFEKYGIQFDAK